MEYRIDINLGIAGEPDEWAHSACPFARTVVASISMKNGKIVSGP
ncbi:MAG: hypothetical protein ACRETC_04615 [Gammaproteobacteria bacterium]